MYANIFGQLGWINFFDLGERNKVIAALAWSLPFIWTSIYLFINLPVVMILSGGIVGSIMLFVIVFAVLHFRYRDFQPTKPSAGYDFALWVSIISIIGVGIYGLTSLL